jgi:hypothetical protein
MNSPPYGFQNLLNPLNLSARLPPEGGRLRRLAGCQCYLTSIILLASVKSPAVSR